MKFRGINQLKSSGARRLRREPLILKTRQNNYSRNLGGAIIGPALAVP
jgi:hypothetical protein